MIFYALTIFLSAFLLFQVQPIIAKMILPWFGGTAAVWATCLLFFQSVLLLGYGYSHGIVGRLKPRRQWMVHATLLVLCLLALPIVPSAAWKPADPSVPIWRILGLLAATVGLPYFMISTTGPLLQAWFVQANPGKSPYRLYALSNLGSMLALLSYPVVIEPSLTLHHQAITWSVAFAVFVVLCIWTGWRSQRTAGTQAAVAATDSEPAPPAPSWRLRLYWVALAAIPSTLLLALTNHLTQDVAPIPFLWVLPLALYLLSFILCFDAAGWYRRTIYISLLPVALGIVAYQMDRGPRSLTTFSELLEMLPDNWAVRAWLLAHSPADVYLPIALFCAAFFVCAMVCHGELSRLKPHPRHLTSFFLMMSVGGAVGGVFVALIAPSLFNANYEFPIAVGACGVIAMVVLYREADSPFANAGMSLKWKRIVIALAVGWAAFYILRAGLGLVARYHAAPPNNEILLAFEVSRASLGLFCSFVMLVLFASNAKSPSQDRFGWPSIALLTMSVALIGCLGAIVREDVRDSLFVGRNFYGELCVRQYNGYYDMEGYRSLVHGAINHGEQYTHPSRRKQPVTYYCPETGVGRFMQSRAVGAPKRIAVIGLGAGTLAAYSRPGDFFRFYDINPMVPRIATNFFTYVKDADGLIDIMMGDARLSLERQAPQDYDLIAVDAFSSDSIPVHLLTKEALQLYFRHLKPRGVLAIHISNRYLNLQPVLERGAAALGKTALVYETDQNDDGTCYGTTWVVIVSDASIFSDPAYHDGAPAQPAPWLKTWTDDYSNLFKVMR